jgi:hypothetical protein
MWLWPDCSAPSEPCQAIRRGLSTPGPLVRSRLGRVTGSGDPRRLWSGSPPWLPSRALRERRQLSAGWASSSYQLAARRLHAAGLDSARYAAGWLSHLAATASPERPECLNVDWIQPLTTPFDLIRRNRLLCPTRRWCPPRRRAKWSAPEPPGTGLMAPGLHLQPGAFWFPEVGGRAWTTFTSSPHRGWPWPLRPA